MFDATLRDETAIELVRRRELVAVLASMSAAGVRPLVFKGAALAFTHYAFPAERPHLDVDLLVEESAVTVADRVLEDLDYRRPLRISGSLIKSQATYLKEDAYGVLHTIDLHWKISIPQAFAAVFPFDELSAAAVPIPALGAGARAPGPVHALAIACVHRVAHHAGDGRPVWLQDIHRLVERLDAGEVRAFCAFAGCKGISRVCRDGIERAARQCGTALPEGLPGGLDRAIADRPAEPSAAFLRPGLRPIDVLFSDLAALPTWSQRARLVREYLVPPAQYVRQAYGTRARAMLPLLYAWRAVKGAGRWFQMSEAKRR